MTEQEKKKLFKARISFRQKCANEVCDLGDNVKEELNYFHEADDAFEVIFREFGLNTKWLEFAKEIEKKSLDNISYINNREIDLNTNIHLFSWVSRII